MFKKPNYVYGRSDVRIPARLNAGEFIIEKLLTHKDITAFVNGVTNESITYSEIAQQSMNLAFSLTRLGMRKGQVVALCSENRLEFFPALIGTLCTGAAISPVNSSYTEDEMTRVINISKPSYIICSPTTFKKHEEMLRKSNFIKNIIVFGDERKDGVLFYNDLAIVNNGRVGTSDGTETLSKNVAFEEFQAVDVEGQTDIAVILYSSGTTGLPKGVMWTHYNLVNSYAQRTPKPGLRSLFMNPWYHAMAITVAGGGIIEGRTIFHLPKFDVEVFLEIIEKFKITWITVVPQMLIALSKSSVQRDVSCAEVLFCGAAPLRENVAKGALKKFPKAKVIQAYGMTECTAVVAQDYNLDILKFGSVGTVTPGYILKITDIKTGESLGPNQHGEICVKGPAVMNGYIDKDKSEGFDDEGFYKTGDIGYYDEDKYFFIVDRLKEIIKYKGYQVAPAEIEAVLLQHEAVRDAGVVGIPSDVAGEVPLGFVVTQPGATVTEQQLQDFVAEKLSHPKRLRGGVRFVEAIPRNPSGKIMRRIMKEMAKIESIVTPETPSRRSEVRRSHTKEPQRESNEKNHERNG